MTNYALKKNSIKDHLINKYDFLNYFKNPKPFLFLEKLEMEKFFEQDDYASIIEELNSDEMTLLLAEYDSPIHLLKENSKKLNILLEEKLKTFYLWKFKLTNENFHDHRVHIDSLEQFQFLLKKDKDFFIFQPKLKIEGFQINPAAIMKYKNQLYIIENFFSMTLKRENIAYLLFYEYVFEKLLKVKIDQYLFSYFRNAESKNSDLLIDITNGLPFSKKTYKPINPIDSKLKNVNVFLGKKTGIYDGTLYEMLFESKDFYTINNKEWDFTRIEVNFVIEELKNFKNNPKRDININELMIDFLTRKKELIPTDSTWFRFLLKNYFKNYDFSNAILSFNKMFEIIAKTSNKEQQENILKTFSELKFLDFPEDQNFILFEHIEQNFIKELKKGKKIYYDFETLLFPVPLLPNIKPYRQLVVQFSALETIEDKEVKIKNLIFDPQTLSLDNYRQLIDELYDTTQDIAYIVYNKAFENARLSEIQIMLNEEKYSKKIDWIISNTVDLADYFKWNKKPNIIHKKLKGFHSIKKVINLIPKELLTKTGTIRYSNLYKCQNGLVASNLFMERILSEKNIKVHDKTWAKNKEAMIAYCENDVRSMWAIDLFIQYLISKNQYPFYSLEKYQNYLKI